MSMEAINSLIDGDVTAFRNHIETSIMAKLADRLELEKAEVASQFFGDDSSDHLDESSVNR